MMARPVGIDTYQSPVWGWRVQQTTGMMVITAGTILVVRRGP